MYKGIEASVECPWPYTDPYLTLHPDAIMDVAENWKKTNGEEKESSLFFRRQQTLIPQAAN